MQVLIFGVLAFWGVSVALLVFAFIGVKVSSRIRHWFVGDD